MPPVSDGLSEMFNAFQSGHSLPASPLEAPDHRDNPRPGRACEYSASGCGRELAPGVSRVLNAAAPSEAGGGMSQVMRYEAPFNLAPCTSPCAAHLGDMSSFGSPTIPGNR